MPLHCFFSYIKIVKKRRFEKRKKGVLYPSETTGRTINQQVNYDRKTDKRYEQKFYNKEIMAPKHNYSKICELKCYSTISHLIKNLKTLAASSILRNV